MPDVFPDLSSLLKLCGSFCHQLAGRSPHFEDTVFPLCYRCSGLYLGFLSSNAYLGLTGGWNRRLPDLRCTPAISLLTLPFLIDIWTKPLGFWTSPGWIRSATGLGVGVVLPLLLVPLGGRESTARATRSDLKPTVSNLAELLCPIVIGSVMLWLVMNPGRLLLFQFLAVLAGLGPLLFLIIFCAVLRSNFAGSWSFGTRP